MFLTGFRGFRVNTWNVKWLSGFEAVGFRDVPFGQVHVALKTLV